MNDTRFTEGDYVRSAIETQGLSLGVDYIVVKVVRNQIGIFGDTVQYLLRSVEDDMEILVDNGDLFLVKIEPGEEEPS